MKHLIDPTDLTLSEIDDILTLAEDIIRNKEAYAHVADGKKLATLFYEPSTGHGSALKLPCWSSAALSSAFRLRIPVPPRRAKALPILQEQYRNMRMLSP